MTIWHCLGAGNLCSAGTERREDGAAGQLQEAHHEGERKAVEGARGGIIQPVRGRPHLVPGMACVSRTHCAPKTCKLTCTCMEPVLSFAAGLIKSEGVGEPGA